MWNNFIIHADETGIRIDRWVRRKFSKWPHSLMQKSFREGHIRLQGRKILPSSRLISGQEIQIKAHLMKICFDARNDYDDSRMTRHMQWMMSTSERVKNWIIYEDDEILVINKPHRLASQGGSKQRAHLLLWLHAWKLAMLDAQVKEVKTPKMHLVHRLDFATAGVMVVAKTAFSATFLSQSFAQRQVRKTYVAVVLGVMPEKFGVINQPLYRCNDQREKVVIHRNGKKAQTAYRVLRVNSSRNISLVEFSPYTGRMHQIRAHAAWIGCPIVGDDIYASGTAFDETQSVLLRHKTLHLLARRLHFQHPRTHELMTFKAKISNDMRDVFKDFFRINE